MTLDELQLLERLIKDYIETKDRLMLVTVLNGKEMQEAKFIIEREIKMKVNDPRIFAKDRDESR